MTTDPLPGVCDDLVAESEELLAVLRPLTDAQWLTDTDRKSVV